MSVAFAGSQSIDNSAPPITTYPFTVGLWAFTPGNGGRAFFGLANNANTTDYFFAGQNVGNNFSLIVSTIAGNVSANIATEVNSTWNFCLYRFISAANRRISVLDATGRVSHAQNTTSRSPSGINAAAFGRVPSSTPQFPFTGNVAEFWWTSADIQIDGAQTQDALVRQLAYGGPFSVPSVVKDIIEYRAFRVFPDTRGDRLGDDYYDPYGQQIWVNNGATIVAHPPLPYWYAKPPKMRRSLRPFISEALYGATSPQVKMGPMISLIY